MTIADDLEGFKHSAFRLWTLDCQPSRVAYEALSVAFCLAPA